MDEANTSIRDYYVLPWLEAGRTPTLRLAPENGILLDAYRFDTLWDAFVEKLTKRVPLRVEGGGERRRAGNPFDPGGP